MADGSCNAENNHDKVNKKDARKPVQDDEKKVAIDSNQCSFM